MHTWINSEHHLLAALFTKMRGTELKCNNRLVSSSSRRLTALDEGHRLEFRGYGFGGIKGLVEDVRS